MFTRGKMRYNRKSLQIITEPTTTPVTLSDLKVYLRVESTEEDWIIQEFIEAATSQVQNYIKRAIITQTLELTMDGFADYTDEKLLALGAGVHTGSRSYLTGYSSQIDLPMPPVQSITSIKTFNRSNTESTFSSSNYELNEQGGAVYLNDGALWPSDLRDREAVKVRYVAGYGDSGSSVPKPIIQTIRSIAAEMYDCRESCELTTMHKTMLSPYRLIDRLGFC